MQTFAESHINLKIHSIDMKKTFKNEELEEDIHKDQIERFVQKKEGTSCVQSQ